MTTPGQHGPLDLPAIRTWNQRNAASRAEYERAPHVGNFSGYRAPCLTCTKPTYSKAGVCRVCKSKGDS